MGKLDGKVALVTGAGSGIGRGVAILFAKEGAKVGVVDYVPAGAKETVRMIVDASGQAVAIEANVSKASDAQRMVRDTVKAFGRLDILSNNAGISQTYAPTADIPEEEWDRVMNTNLKGVFLVCKYAIPVMLSHGGGVIVNTSSGSGLCGDFNNAAYSTSKGGVIQLTKTMALDYARHDIRVNCICPGLIATGMSKDLVNDAVMLNAFLKYQPMNRVGQPEDIAGAALYLASEDSRYVTGATLVVDGGLIVGGRPVDYTGLGAPVDPAKPGYLAGQAA